MIDLRKKSGFIRFRSSGPVTMYQHTGSGKFVVITKDFNGNLIHQGKQASLPNLESRKLVTLKTAEKHFADLTGKLGI